MTPLRTITPLETLFYSNLTLKMSKNRLTIYLYLNWPASQAQSKDCVPPRTLAFICSAPYDIDLNLVQIGLSSIQELSLNGNHSMGLRRNGNLMVWGANENGVLGLGNEGPLTSREPVQLPNLYFSQVDKHFHQKSGTNLSCERAATKTWFWFNSILAKSHDKFKNQVIGYKGLYLAPCCFNPSPKFLCVQLYSIFSTSISVMFCVWGESRKFFACFGERSIRLLCWCSGYVQSQDIGSNALEIFPFCNPSNINIILAKEPAMQSSMSKHRICLALWIIFQIEFYLHGIFIRIIFSMYLRIKASKQALKAIWTCNDQLQVYR